MAIILAGIELPDDLDWQDEYGGWSPIQREHTKGSTGKLIIQSGQLKEGRPITLASASQGSTGAWCKRSVVEQIRAKLNETGVMPLTLHDRILSVVWAPEGAFSAEQLIRIADPDGDDYYTILLKLIEVSQ